VDVERSSRSAPVFEIDGLKVSLHNESVEQKRFCEAEAAGHGEHGANNNVKRSYT